MMFCKTDLASRWLMVVVDMYCDVQPDCDEAHLPFGQKKDLYFLYQRCITLSDKMEFWEF
jgi:hypothetical protein